MICFRYLVLFSSLLIAASVFGQKRKHVVHYKTIYDKEFSVGDRIDMGEVIVVPIDLEHDSVVIPDSLDLYRKFIHQNTQITFKLHMQWRAQGVKYPRRTNFLRDTLLTFFNEDGKEGEEELCPITYFHHGYIKKQPQLLRVELEVLKIKQADTDGSYIPSANFPEGTILCESFEEFESLFVARARMQSGPTLIIQI